MRYQTVSKTFLKSSVSLTNLQYLQMCHESDFRNFKDPLYCTIDKVRLQSGHDKGISRYPVNFPNSNLIVFIKFNKTALDISSVEIC